MSKNGNLGVLGGGFIGVETNKVYTPPQHATSVNGKTLEQLNDDFDDFIEEIEMPSEAPLDEFQEQAPVEVAENLESPAEAPVSKKKSGRKARNTEDLHASVEMIAKKHAIHESEILEITFKSMMEKVLLELMCRELLSAYDVHEDSAPALLVYMWHKASMVDGRRVYLDTLQQTAEGAEIGYSNVQKLVKKMTEKGLLEKGRNGLTFSALLEDFFSSLTENKQILLTFEKLQEEQMESIDEEGHINESMAN
ncbi:hypothetical protein [Streptococcus mitis]|uniref:hypothetical protein n=1 Tax=Streptococcus mitis TaxID=28037 RepID=UPI001F46B97C|nr:hypothetical protein [Streptococcus mitis]